MMKPAVLAALLFAALPFALAHAAGPSGPPGSSGGPGHRPPQVAFDACAQSSEGAACTVTLGERTERGTCEKAPDASALVCWLSRPPGPPPAAVQACTSAKEQDACTFVDDGQSISGTCGHGPDGGGPLACGPARPAR